MLRVMMYLIQNYRHYRITASNYAMMEDELLLLQRAEAPSVKVFSIICRFGRSGAANRPDETVPTSSKLGRIWIENCGSLSSKLMNSEWEFCHAKFKVDIFELELSFVERSGTFPSHGAVIDSKMRPCVYSSTISFYISPLKCHQIVANIKDQ